MLYPILFVLIAASLAAFWIWKGTDPKTSPDLWAAFVHAKVPVLICIDTHNLQPLALDQSPDRDRFVNLVLRRQIISLDDLRSSPRWPANLARRLSHSASWEPT